ncbi:hypothetical protein GGF46_003791 [Coemansia sp. RSA 552]|nr:hypothetical protein GGF46_003791 [Coemansia sp. RSA 552]
MEAKDFHKLGSADPRPGANPWAAVDDDDDAPRLRLSSRVASRQRAAHDPLMCPSTADIDKISRAAALRAEHGLVEDIGDAVSSPLPRTKAFMVGTKSDSAVGSAALLVGEHDTVKNSSLAGEPRTIKMIRHSIRPGDTVEGISVQYGIHISHLKRLNRLWQPSELAIRSHVYIPLRMCLPRFTIANIQHVNIQYREELQSGHAPTISPIDLIEVVLDPENCPDLGAKSVRRPPWPLVSYESIQHVFSFAL